MFNTRYFAPERFSHASAISSHKGGTMLAFYSGEAECHSSQKVYIYFTDKDGKTYKPVKLEGYTGNPILLNLGDRVRIIYSKFEKLVQTRVHWWQHCSLWMRDLYFSPKIIGGGDIIVSDPHKLDFDGEGTLGYLPRCNPLKVDDGWLIPLYREKAPAFHGVVLHTKDGIDFTLQGEIGKEKRCIQPTLFHSDGEIHALLRNFNSSVFGARYTYHSASKDGGKSWSKIKNSKFLNANNSIVAIKADEKTLVIWNNDPTGRRNITLSTIDGTHLKTIDSYGSYPSACINGNKLQIAYTAIADKLKFSETKTAIKVVEYSLDAISSL